MELLVSDRDSSRVLVPPPSSPFLLQSEVPRHPHARTLRGRGVGRLPRWPGGLALGTALSRLADVRPALPEC